MKMTDPPERAHPEHPGFKRKWFKSSFPRNCLYERYRFCDKYVRKKTVLDIPCGVGWGTSLLKRAKKVFGMDICFDAVKYAGVKFGKRAHYVVGSMSNLPFPKESFDVVTCLEGLEHVELEIALPFIAETRRILRSNGLFVVTVPLMLDGKHSGNPFHVHEFEREEAEELLCGNFKKIVLEEFEGPGAREIRFVGENIYA